MTTILISRHENHTNKKLVQLQAYSQPITTHKCVELVMHHV